MSLILTVKDPKSKANVSPYSIAQEKSKGATLEEFGVIARINSEVMRASKLMDILRLSDDASKIIGVVHNKEFISTKGVYGLDYIHRAGESLLWAEKMNLMEAGFFNNSIILEFNQNSQFNFAERKGLTVISYNGILSGSQAFTIGEDLKLTEVDPAAVSLKRV